jgi:hypothetical protein
MTTQYAAGAGNAAQFVAARKGDVMTGIFEPTPRRL